MNLRLAFFLVFAFVFISAPCLAGDETPIVPHRAMYRMSLEKARAGSDVASVEGTMLFDWADACDGWAVQQRMKLRISHVEGDDSDIDSTVVMWESKDGKSYSFNVRRLVGGQEDENYKGRAELDAAGNKAVYALPKDKGTVELPADTVFPAEHTKMIVQMARGEEKFFTRRVFDGSDEAGSADVSVFLGPPVKAIDKKGLSKELLSNALLNVVAWPVRLAFFSPDTETGLPDYEMDIVMQENGIARSMRIDYGDFTVRGDLASLEAPPSSLCPK